MFCDLCLLGFSWGRFVGLLLVLLVFWFYFDLGVWFSGWVNCGVAFAFTLVLGFVMLFG